MLFFQTEQMFLLIFRDKHCDNAFVPGNCGDDEQTEGEIKQYGALRINDNRGEYFGGADGYFGVLLGSVDVPWGDGEFVGGEGGGNEE